MSNKKIEMDNSFRRVLLCVKEQRNTAEEIRVRYIQLYPQGLVAKVLVPPVSLVKIKAALLWLHVEGFINKELTIFTDRALKEYTDVFWISNKGRSYLLPKK